MKKNYKFFCEVCGKELKELEDWFVVNDNLWEDYCRLMKRDKRMLSCTKCFEDVIGEIKVSDLKLLKRNNKNIELICNFWIIKKFKDKSRIQFIKNGLGYDEKFDKERIKLIEFLSSVNP